MRTSQKHLTHPAIALVSLIILVMAVPSGAFSLSDSDMSDAAIASLHASLPLPVPEVPLTVIEGEIERKPVYDELVDCGVAPAEVLSLTKSFKGVFDFRKARPRDEYRICLTPQKKLQKLIYKTSPTDMYVAIRTTGGEFNAFRQEIPLEKKIVARLFTIQTSLYEAVTEMGEDGRLVAEFTDIFSWDIDFYLFPRKGDTIRILFEKFFLEGEFVKYGKILTAQYINSSKTFPAYYFEDGHQDGYYDEEGVPLRKMFLRVPVKFGLRTSSFSIRRFHPISKKYKRHTGIDYSAPLGTPIFATAGGTVEFAGRRGGYGNLVIIRHPNGFKTYYGHCNRLLVKKGAYVEQGEIIAKVGRTGQATGPHVHYETRVNGKPVDPAGLKTERGTPLAEDQRLRFKALLQTRMQMMADLLFPEKYQIAGKAADLH